MTRLEINPAVVRLVKSYFDGRTFQIMVEQVFSLTRNITAKVPQGPEICLIFVSNMLREFLAVYAVDTVTFSSCELEGSHSADCKSPWTRWSTSLNGGSINVGKTVAIRFTRRTGPFYDSLSFAGRRLPWSPEAKYLRMYPV